MRTSYVFIYIFFSKFNEFCFLNFFGLNFYFALNTTDNKCFVALKYTPVIPIGEITTPVSSNISLHTAILRGSPSST